MLDDRPISFDTRISTTAFTTLICAVVVSSPEDEVRVTVLVFRPMDVPVTFTEKLQTELAAMLVAPVIVMLEEPGLAVMVSPVKAPLGEHATEVNPFGVATTRPAGKLSVKLTLLIDVEFGFENVKVNWLVSVGEVVVMVLSANPLEIVGDATTFRVA